MNGNSARGFTLVEIAIVMVIIGLLLGGALKGQQMIENARYKRLQAEIEEFRSAMYSFQDIYRALPGDMSQADAQRLLTASGITPGGATGNSANNGEIDGGYCNRTGEDSCFVWQHLRAAGLLAGDASLVGADSMPETPVGGVYDTISTGDWGNGQRNLKLLMRNVPGEIGQRLDEQFDDGDPRGGDISCYRGGTGADSGCTSWNTSGNDAVFVTM